MNVELFVIMIALFWHLFAMALDYIENGSYPDKDRATPILRSYKYMWNSYGHVHFVLFICFMIGSTLIVNVPKLKYLLELEISSFWFLLVFILSLLFLLFKINSIKKTKD